MNKNPKYNGLFIYVYEYIYRHPPHTHNYFRCEWKTSKFSESDTPSFLDNIKFTPGRCGYLCPTS